MAFLVSGSGRQAMIKLDSAFLDEVGLGTLRPESKKGLLQHAYESLEERVGASLADDMSEPQLDEFGTLSTNNGDALQWLELNFPYYRELVQYQLARLRHQLRLHAHVILAEDGARAGAVA